MEPVFAVFMQLVVVAAIVVPLLLYARHKRQERDADWARLAAERGLHFQGGSWTRPSRVFGELEGLPVAIEIVTRGSGKHQQAYTVARAQVPGGLPDGFSVSREGLEASIAKLFGGQDIQLGDPGLDGKLRIRGDGEAEIREALLRPTLSSALYGMAAQHRYSRVQSGQVHMEVTGYALRPQVDDLLDRAVALAHGLGEGFRVPWAALARERGLSLSEQGSITVLEGRIEGLSVSVRAERGGDLAVTRIRVTLPQELPGGLELRLARREGGGQRQGIGLGDPVLDGLLAASARDPEVARRLPAAADPADDLHGLLLAVLHGHPGSVVTSHEVVLRAPGVTPSAVPEQLDQALGLAKALHRAVQRLGAQATDADAAERARRAAAKQRS